MGAIMAVLFPSITGGEKFSFGNTQHELDFLKGLARTMPGRESCSFLPPGARMSSLGKYPVPSFLTNSGYEAAVNIAVTGNSGVGKSLFINTVRGVKHGEDSWAPVGVSDTTKDPRFYSYPGEPRVRLWDLEGALSGQVPTNFDPSSDRSVENYIRQIGLRYFDVVLLLSSGRLTETEAILMKELQAFQVPFFFVRTKLDWDIENGGLDYGMEPEEVETDIREDLKANGIAEPYLVNARALAEYDFPKLIREVLMVMVIRWPDLMQQSVSDIASVEDPVEQQQGGQGRATSVCDKAMGMHSKQEQVESLARYTGHWYWVEDDGWLEYLSAEIGSIASSFSAMLFSNSEQRFTILEDGRWCQAITNSSTGSTPAKTWFTPSDDWCEELETDVFGQKLRGRGIDFILGGCKLVSEIKGVHIEPGKEPVKLHFRYIREVVNDRYIMTNQNLVKDIHGKRIYKRYPHFVLDNETNATVSLSLYSGWTPIASLTLEVSPGRQYVDTSGKSIEVEKAVFTLEGRKLTVSALKAYEPFTLRKEDFH